jgi:hypothetical protein
MVVIILGAIFLGPKIRDFFQQAKQVTDQAQVAGREMQAVWAAVEKYHQDKGKYPDELETLVPKYLKKEQLRFSQEPEGPKFSYYKPGKDTQSSDMVMEYKGLTMFFGDREMPFRVRLLKDGQVEFENQRLPASGGSP